MMMKTRAEDRNGSDREGKSREFCLHEGDGRQARETAARGHFSLCLTLVASVHLVSSECMMAHPPQLCDLKAKVSKEEQGAGPVCVLDMTVTKDSEKHEVEEYQLRLSPDVLTTTIDSLLKVRSQLDAIAQKTKA
ncbi:hypothetical protein O3P69_003561 [Scylla paramamosain]|uniref:COMM domain-containing protein n=1 Tax=Scylla paramamosain TaxID=85552 RepID=A0AAW0UJC3_SCYPA